MFRIRVVVTLLLLIVTAASAASAADFGNLHWRLVGPFRGGRVLAVAGDPSDVQHFYFGAVNGGVWESHDAGRTWNPIFDSQPVGSIGALALAPSDPKTIYAGTGEADMRSDIAQGDGMYKSVDAGKTWMHIGLTDTRQIQRILVDPSDARHVYVAALGHPYGPNHARGVFESHDSGANWRKILGPNPDTGAIDLAFEPGNPSTIYAALWQTRRPPWNVYPPSNGPGSGLYKSTDGGAHWTHIEGHGFASGTLGRIGLATSAAAPQRVYAIVDGDDGGLYRSDDAGTTWIKTSGDARIWQRGWYFGEIAADPKNPDRIYAMNTIVLRSDDGGKTFNALKGDPTGDDFHALWIDPSEPQRQILGADQGALVTLDGGKTWSSWYNQPTAQIYHVSTDNRFPYWIYGAQQDSGAVGLPSRGDSGDGITMREFDEVAVGGESDNIAPDPDDPQTVFGGRVDKLDLRTQQVRNIDPTLALPGLSRGTWTLPLVFSPRQPHVLFFANQRVFRTDDRGEHWQPISPDLTREDPGAPKNLDHATVADNLGQGPRRGVIYSIAPSSVADGFIWAGTDDGLIWRTRDGGVHWDNVTPKALTSWSKVGVIDASPFDAGTAYAAIDRHRLDDQKPYIYRTHDGGKNWQLIVTGLPANQSANVVRADPVRKGLLYSGTERGVYLSFDDGEHWQSLQRNLPVTSVRDIAIHGADLVLATHGRGIYVMDDISALRQTDAKEESAKFWLFAPAPAYRVRLPEFTGTPMPKDEPMAPNPPLGAYLDYTLNIPPNSPISLDIFDSHGGLVRHYSSADAAAPTDPAKLSTAPEWVQTPSTLSVQPGTHRFVWPLHYPAPVPAGKPDPWADGLWAPPGDYRVVLTVDGVKQERPLRVLADPRLHLPASAYAEEFALAQSIQAQSERVASAARESDAMLHALDAIKAKRLAHDVETVRIRVQAISGEREVPNPHNALAFPPRDTKNFKFLAGSLMKLQSAVDGADAMPSIDAQNGYKALLPIIDAVLQAWEELKSREVAGLNAKLKAIGKEPIDLK
ncbi:MAG: WD40/YVTN/BNR-like repeat-containing protein [Rudaea sp.]